jgi:hypothetical protein
MFESCLLLCMQSNNIELASSPYRSFGPIFATPSRKMGSNIS